MNTGSIVVTNTQPSSALDFNATMLQLNIEVAELIGEGTYGRVFKCTSLKNKRSCAVKFVGNGKHAKDCIREGQRISNCVHPNIVAMYQVHELQDGSCALEMELVPGGDLSKHLRRHRLPHETVLRFTRQLLEVLAYLHDEKQWLHGDIKPQNILVACPVSIDGASPADYSDAVIKLADFGLAKTVITTSDVSQSLMLTNAPSEEGKFKGTDMYMSPDARMGRGRGFADDVWSACVVILEMDTGLSLTELMIPGAVTDKELLTKTSPHLLPLLYFGLSSIVETPRRSARDLLQLLEASIQPLFEWQVFTGTAFVAVHPAAEFFLENCLINRDSGTLLPLPPPLDLCFNIAGMLSSSSLSRTALGSQTRSSTRESLPIRRILKRFDAEIPIWQKLKGGKEWRQCKPAICAKNELEMRKPSGSSETEVGSVYRRLVLRPSGFDSVEMPFQLRDQPYLAPAHAADIAALTSRVHESLPEWDITEMNQVVNKVLATQYACNRHIIAARCNGDPNERLLFHFPHPDATAKIWQQGDGHDPRMSLWAEVGKGAYFSEHVIYGYAYKYKLWPCGPDWVVKHEPPSGSTMQVFASLVTLGNTADIGPGCETCMNPPWIKWKNEFSKYEKPPKPPQMVLPEDAAERQHLLDMMKVQNPSYYSVTSTEGDLATHSQSTNKLPSGERVGDIMHPRLKSRAREWGQQYVVFQTAASYPMFLITLTKIRDSPMDAQQMRLAGSSATRMKMWGFCVEELARAGYDAGALRHAGFDLDKLCAVFSCSQLRDAGYRASELQVAGFDVPTLLDAGFYEAEFKSPNRGDRNYEETEAWTKLSEVRKSRLRETIWKHFLFVAKQVHRVQYDAYDVYDFNNYGKPSPSITRFEYSTKCAETPPDIDTPPVSSVVEGHWFVFPIFIFNNLFCR
jgi:serine/threonine protein kinase